MDKKTLNQLEQMQKKLGFKSRSKMLRSAMQSLSKDYEGMDGLRGDVESVFVVTYPYRQKNRVSDLLRGFEDVMRADLHHLHRGTCIDIFNLETDAKTTRKFYGMMKSSKAVHSVSYSVVGGMRGG